ncbi:MAG: ElyC/SanA/YdcF family protein [Myxococcota bacterium]|nr:ElyC/SanA/YdcF family protein [Myxococcota bacterium]
MKVDAVLVMGKELRLDRERGLRELRARAAAASVVARRSESVLMALEAPLRGQKRSGSTIVAELWEDLGHDRSEMLLRSETYSTRQEAMLARRLATQHGVRRLCVFTASYHLARTRRLFEEHFSPGSFCVLAPEACLRGSNETERSWILGGTVSEETLNFERSRERRWERLELLVRPLPAALRWNLECQAGRLLRRSNDSVSP